jgi:hypothetical protein
MIVTYCNRYHINDQINALWNQLNMPINDNLENGLKLFEQIKEIRRRMLL